MIWRSAELARRTASSVAAPGTTMPGTAGPRTGTGTRPRTGTTTLAFVLPELLTCVDAPGLTRRFSAALRPRGPRQNRKAAGALVEDAGPAKARRRLALKGVPWQSIR